jgi:hypothetical protein
MKRTGSGGTRVTPTGVGVACTETRRQRGRHRRARGDWWRELLWPGTTTALTVRQALGQWQRERTCPYPRDARAPRPGSPGHCLRQSRR